MGTGMRAMMAFTIHEGQPKILAALFSASRDGVQRADVDTLPRELAFYGTDGTRGSVYVHLLVENLVGVNSGQRLVRSDVSIEVDFFAVKADSAKTARDQDNLKETTTLDEELNFTVVLKLAGKTITPGSSLDDCVTCDKSTKRPPLFISQLQSVAGSTLFDLCFELPVGDELLNPLEEREAYTKRVIGWAWAISKEIKQQYDQRFWAGGGADGLDIGSPKERRDFLQNEHRAERWFNALFYPEKSLRAEYNALEAPVGHFDPFIYDEPTWNVLRFSKYFPFEKLEVATQLGAVGLCNNNVKTYYENGLLNEHVDSLDFGSKAIDELGRANRGGTPVSDGFLLAKNGTETFSIKPQVPKKLAIGDPAFPYSVNELQNTFEEQYLFREGTAAQWLNTIEKSILVGGTEHKQPARGAVITKDELRDFTNGSKGKVPVFSYDFQRDYRDKVPSPQSMMLLSVWEQKELDLGELETVSIPEAKVMDSTGAFRFELGKGFPASSQRCLNWLHTKVKIEGDSANDAWQAHPYCHRPIFLVYELHRDLEGPEEARLEDAWKSKKSAGELGLSIQVGEEAEGSGSEQSSASVFVPFPFLDKRCGKKGKHLILLYVTLPHRGSLKISITPAGVIETPPWMGLNLRGSVAIEVETVGSLVTYRTDDINGATLSGLFEGNPLVSIESLTPLETRQKALDSDTKKYEISTGRDQGKLILTFIPAYGPMLAAGWELGLRLVDFSASGKNEPVYRGKMIELGVTILAEVLGRMLKIREAAAKEAGRSVNKALKWTSSDNGKAIFNSAKGGGAYLDKVDNDFKDLELRIQAHRSPFKRSAQFQKDPRVKDQAVLIRLRKQEWELKADKGGFIGVEVPRMEEVAEVFFVRPVDLSATSKLPFYYCFGQRGGLLERDDGAADCSIDIWESRYFKSLADYKTAVPDELSVDQYFAWLTDPVHLAATPFSKSLKAYFAENAAAFSGGPALELNLAASNQKLTEGSKEYNDVLVFQAGMHLLNYLNATSLRCPSCGKEMQHNWGWCPYHPQVPGKGLLELGDKNKSGSWKDEFLEALKDPGPDRKWKLGEKVFGPKRAVGSVAIVDYLERLPADEPTRLFVHCSEFIVIK